MFHMSNHCHLIPLRYCIPKSPSSKNQSHTRPTSSESLAHQIRPSSRRSRQISKISPQKRYIKPFLNAPLSTQAVSEDDLEVASVSSFAFRSQSPNNIGFVFGIWIHQPGYTGARSPTSMHRIKMETGNSLRNQRLAIGFQFTPHSGAAGSRRGTNGIE